MSTGRAELYPSRATTPHKFKLDHTNSRVPAFEGLN
jgi:hypothetical protein